MPAKSPLWLQIVSDVTGLPQDVPQRTIGASYGDAFLAGIALSPLAWLGVIALALAGVLFVVGQRLEGRKAGTGDGKSVEKRRQRAVEAGPAAAGDDMAEIEEILRRHGIQ